MSNVKSHFCPCSCQGLTTLKILFTGFIYLEVDFEKQRVATRMMVGVKSFVQSWEIQEITAFPFITGEGEILEVEGFFI